MLAVTGAAESRPVMARKSTGGTTDLVVSPVSRAAAREGPSEKRKAEMRVAMAPGSVRLVTLLFRIHRWTLDLRRLLEATTISMLILARRTSRSSLDSISSLMSVRKRPSSLSSTRDFLLMCRISFLTRVPRSILVLLHRCLRECLHMCPINFLVRTPVSMPLLLSGLLHRLQQELDTVWLVPITMTRANL